MADDDSGVVANPVEAETPADLTPEPSEAEITPQAPQEHPPFDNLAEMDGENYKHESILKKFRDRAKTKFAQYVGERDQWDGDEDGVWALADFMYRCGRNNSQRDAVQTDDTLADTASTLYFRQVRAVSAYLAAIYNSQKDPTKFTPLRQSAEFADAEEADAQAKWLNALMRWTRQKNNDRNQVFDFCNLVCRYGSTVEMVTWKYRTGVRRKREPVKDPVTGNVIGYKQVEERVVVDNHPERKILPLECLYADIHIGNLQQQQDIIIRTQDELGTLWSEAQDGQILNIDKIKARDYSVGEEDSAMHRVRQENRGLEEGDDSQTGLVTRFDCWMKAPIAKNDSGEYEWDAKKNMPAWWWATFAGDIENGPCLCLRRNPDPDDEFPGYLSNLFPDDPDILYHISPAEVIKPVWDELTTKKNQAIDNVTLQNRRPLKGIRGEVFSKDLTYAQDKVLWVERPESLTEMQVASQLGDTMAMVNYLEEEANRALSTDKPFMGYALGSRTSATEANNVFQRAMQPAAMLAQYVFSGREEFFARKCKGLWRLYALDDQAIEITGEPEPMVIKPAELHGDFDIEVVVVDEFMNDAIAAQNMNYFLQAAPALPGFQQDVDTKAVIRRFMELYKFDTNPARYIRQLPAVDAEKVAKMENMAMFNGKWDEPQPGEDHATHLRIHVGFRTEFNGLEDRYPPQVTQMLDQHIAQTELLQQQEAAQQMGASVPGNETPGEVAGNALAGPMGAMNMGGQGVPQV